MAQNPFQSLVARLLGSDTGPNLPLNLDADGNLLVASQGGGEAVSIADGADVTQGAIANAAWSGSGSGTVVAVLKAIWTALTTAVTTQPKGGSFLNVAANGTSAAIKTGAGVLLGVSINTKGASANVLTIYDSLTGSGTKIGTFDTTAGPAYIPLNAAFATGLSAVLATGTAADITFVYR